ncbi:interactor of constitutive active ROPs 1 [Brachypodium distachyon]|uniref:interactor of constitutive active ROPs 1 n=1 Tax=Brachypodium distachyon TaxID=15368 RepID=UPI00071C942B|nr:interactor of constitutive active ROPs 1 [Brachypodium distachyon]|eukprot:XP_014753940.1 interactor of constitutive active ROPs 1 [Brachypodium distachyon]
MFQKPSHLPHISSYVLLLDPMLGRAAHAKKPSKFEDSDSSHMSRPRGVSELPHRPAPRLPPHLTKPAATAPVVWEANGARHRGLLAAGRGTPPPRSPLHEKKPAGSRAVALEAKLGKAHDQLAEMREQLAAAEKARKDARGAFAEAKKRAAAAKKRDRAVDSVPAEQQQDAAEFAADGVADGGREETRSRSSPATDVLEPALPDTENSVALVVAGGDGEMKGNPEADQLIRAKLAAKDKEAYELRPKLMIKDMEIHDLRTEVAAKDADFDEVMARLIAKDAETAALGAHNAHLRNTAEEATKARGMAEQALRESAAREARLAERLAASERAREALDAEASRVRVQSEQWRKAAEEAAAVLGAGAGSMGEQRRVGARGGGKETRRRRRHGSAGSNGDGMEKRDAADDEGSGGVRKAGGSMRVLTDLWRKKVQK